jgi:hypothetical protein
MHDTRFRQHKMPKPPVVIGNSETVIAPEKGSDAPEVLFKQWKHLQNSVKLLILETEDFIVFIDNRGFVNYETADTYDEDDEQDLEQHNFIMNEVTALETTWSDQLSPRMRLNFKCLIGEALARSFEADYKNAHLMLQSSGEYIKARSQEISRYWYLTSTIVVALTISTLGLLAWLIWVSLKVLKFWGRK